jgi:hypothetical protein
MATVQRGSRIQQVRLSRNPPCAESATEALESDQHTLQASDLDVLEQALKREAAIWPMDMTKYFSTDASYIPPDHIVRVQRIQVALSKALTSIVNRWYEDEKANFSSRMPLDDHEERLLRVENQSPAFSVYYN